MTKGVTDMARKIKAKLIMELREQGVSRRSIATTRHMSMESVCDVFNIADGRGITWHAICDMPEDEVYRLFYPDKHVREDVFEQPDWAYVHAEMAKVGVNLRLLHDEYRSDCARLHKVAMGYTKFCEGYGGHVTANSLTKRIDHKAGVSCEVDWSGPTIGKGLADPVTGAVSKVYLFVGVLPFSQKAYFEPTLDMRERTWLRCHVHMFEYWGGVPERCVCDNLKTGVLKHPREGEIVLNEAYEALGEHYMTAIMPAQVRKPKQKASAEGTVKDAATWVIAQLRNEVFTSFDQVQLAVRKCLSDYNAHPFQKREGSRDSVFSEVEAAQLRPLPDVRYDVAEWVYGRSVNLDFHVVYAKNRYSVPCRYAGRKVDLRVGESTIGIYHAGERIATHRLLPPYVKNGYSTDPAHMPDSFAKPEWDDVRIKGWASDVGPSCRAVVDRIFDGVKLKEQAYNPSLSVLRLSRRYGKDRLEAACDHALPKIRSPRYRHIKAILDANLERGESPEPKRPGGGRPRGHLRGADYYRD